MSNKIQLMIALCLVSAMAMGCEDNAGVVSAECEPSATQCSKDILYTCTESGAWDTGTSCGGLGCKDDHSCRTAESECTQGDQKCENDIQYACTAKGTWDTGTSCGGLGCKDATSCNAAESECTAGQEKCTDDIHYTCMANGTWGAGTSCSGLGCKDATSCSTVAGECSQGEEKCVDDIHYTCTAKGLWDSGESCNGFGCQDESVCKTDAGQCKAGLKKCSDDIIYTCSEKGRWEEALSCSGLGCMNETSCNTVAGYCTDGQKKCIDDILFTCKNTGNWNDGTSCHGLGCKDDSSCNTIAHDCVYEDKKCVKDVAYTCTDKGVWDAGTSCGGLGCKDSSVCNTVASDCSSGGKKCVNDIAYMCTDKGTWDAGTSCGGLGCKGKVCSTVAGDCSNGDKKCVNDIAYTCTAKGTWDSGVSCKGNGCNEETQLCRTASNTCTGSGTLCKNDMKYSCVDGLWSNPVSCKGLGCDTANNVCLIDTCTDHEKDGDETDVDCGGSCDYCGAGKKCKVDSDCVTLNCVSGTCGDVCLSDTIYTSGLCVVTTACKEGQIPVYYKDSSDGLEYSCAWPIRSSTDFVDFRNQWNAGGKYGSKDLFILMNDIDFADYASGDTLDWVGVNEFTGKFISDGKWISYSTSNANTLGTLNCIDNNYACGLFASATKASFKNFNVKLNVTGYSSTSGTSYKYYYVGIVVGMIDKLSTDYIYFDNIRIGGSIKSDKSEVGCLFGGMKSSGDNQAYINEVHSRCNIEQAGSGDVGGIAGYGTVHVTNSSYIGTIASSNTTNVGGIIGNVPFVVLYCKNVRVKAQLTGTKYIGGIFGYIGGAMSSSVTNAMIDVQITGSGGGIGGLAENVDLNNIGVIGTINGSSAYSLLYKGGKFNNVYSMLYSTNSSNKISTHVSGTVINLYYDAEHQTSNNTSSIPVKLKTSSYLASEYYLSNDVFKSLNAALNNGLSSSSESYWGDEKFTYNEALAPVPNVLMDKRFKQ